MATAWLKHGLRGAGLLGICLLTQVPAAHAVPGPAAPRRALLLFSGFLGRMNINQWDCGLDAVGHVCVDPNGSTTVGGGYWPKGTPDQYVFGSGLQVAGVVDPAATFDWAGDTTAAFFEDPSGQHENGQQLSLIWQSTNPSDLASWPTLANVPVDPLYASILQGQKTASQEDVWAWYWDGNPNKNAGRPHALGVLVDQRGMAWNYPSGNEAVQYWVYTIYNVTASDRAVYQAIYGAGEKTDSLTALGTRFRADNNPAIPTTGYAIKDAYVAFAMDPDVSTQAKQNFTTAFLPFNMAIAFKSNWFAADFTYPSAIFSPPFAPTVGEIGVKYLKSPLIDPGNPGLGEIGLVLYSATVNAGAFGDALDASQVYRYMTGVLDPGQGDQSCTYTHHPPGAQPRDYHICYIPTKPADVRFFESSGPFDLAPGQSQTIVVAYIASAPVDNPAIAARSANFIYPVAGPDAEQPESLAAGIHRLTALDSIFGALSLTGDTGGAPGGGPNGRIDQTEVRVVPRSLLGKGLTAQAVFDAHFLLPFAPNSPDFFLVPGDNQVTIVWKESTSEGVQDPYFAIASDNTSPLYDPNYRPFDTEGYRIYRGRTSGDLEVIAQFDKAGTTYIDYTAALQYGNCAPELGNNTVGDGCPADLATGHAVDIASPFVQVAPGSRVKLDPSGNILVIQADSSVTGGGTHNPPLTDTGIPFAFVDHGVKNGFTYFYTVGAYDVNSVKSTGVGSTSLEGRFPPRTVIPRKSSGQESGGGGTTVLQSPGGVALSGTVPNIDRNTGQFSGPIPPTDGLAAGFPLDVGQLIVNASVNMQIDSIVPGNADPDAIGSAAPAVYFITLQRAAPNPPFQIQVPVNVDATDVTASGTAYAPLVALVSKPKSARFNGDSTYALSAGATVTVPGTWRLTSPGRGSANADPTGPENGPRWWAGAANENTPSPNSTVCSPSAGGCIQADLSRTAGAIPGVDSIFHVASYSTVRSLPMRDIEGVLSTVQRAADIAVYWGATVSGSAVVDSVVDLTHKARVAFSPGIRASWGILDDSSFVGVNAGRTQDNNNGLLTWTDIYCVYPLQTFGITNRSGDARICAGPVDTTKADTALLRPRAHLSPIAITSVGDENAPTLTQNGNGFIVYLNGHFFLMKMAALPTAGTVWFARFYAGNVTGAAGSYGFQAATRPPAVPGLRAVGNFTGTTFDSTTTSDSALARIHTVPDPYYVTNSFEVSPSNKVIRFVNLPSECIIRIYSLAGVLVQMLAVHDATSGGEAPWDLRNRNQQFVASGVYFYHVETPDGKAKIGRFTIVNFAQ